MASVWVWQVILTLFGLVCAAPLSPRDSPPIAQTHNGSYFGLHNDHFSQDYFLGVPFAKPPVGEYRLQVPQSLDTAWNGLRNATQYGYACIGYGEDTQIGGGNYVDEDCLSLNIVRPSGYENQSLPVGVWIYGGGWFEGTSLDPRYNLSFIVEQSVIIGKPIIGVSINYRLSGWGWLYSEEIVQAGLANLGLRDLHLGLSWLQENVGAFGGDPTRVTIWGESAGAINVGALILAYNGRDDKLFSGAIAESGPTWGAGMINPTTSEAEKVYANVTESVGCSNTTDRIACLREVPTATLNNVLNGSYTEDYYYIYFGPLVDGDIVARSSLDQLQDGSFIKVPYILGDNSDEGTDFIPFGLNTDDDVSNFFAGFDFDNATLSSLLHLYPDDPSSNLPISSPSNFNSTIGAQFKRAATLISDLTFKAPRRLAATAWLQHTTPNDSAPLYSYRFNTIPNGIPDYFAVTHFQEVSFVFHNVEGQGFPDEAPPYFGADPFGGKPQAYVDLADEMSRRWASFIHDRDPNFAQSTGPTWPAYSLTNATNIVFDANVSTFLEPDTYRAEGIGYIMQKFLSGEEPWVGRTET